MYMIRTCFFLTISALFHSRGPLIVYLPPDFHRKILFFDILRQTPYNSFIHFVQRTLQKNGSMKFFSGGLKAEMRYCENKV